MPKHRILILIKGLGVGGAEMLLVNSIPHLDRKRFDYQVAYMLPWKDDLVGRFVDAGIDVHQIGGRQGSLKTSIRDLATLVREREIGLVDAHLPIPGLAARFAVRGKLPLVYHEHSLSVQRRFRGLRILSFLANVATYGMNDVIVSVSNDTAHDVHRFNRGRTPERVIINGIPLPEQPTPEERRSALEALGVPAGSLVVGHVAKMASKKRQQDLIQAARLVLDRALHVFFVLVGEGPLRENLIKQTVELGIKDRVLIPGFVPELLPLLGAFDVFALTSDHEGLPTVVIEAMSLGIPVVSTAVGGTPELVNDGVTGVLTPPRNPVAFAEALVGLLEDPHRRSEMSAAALARSHEFDIARRVREIEDLYANLLAARVGGRP